MAVSSAILSISSSTKAAPLFSKSSTSLKAAPLFSKSISSSFWLLPPANLRVLRGVTYATASKQATGDRPPRGIRIPRRVSPEMQAVVGASEIPRTQALKRIWVYIKEHGLQDPENKKIIVCDEKLKKIFGKDRVGFLEIAGLISPHFL